MMRLTSVIITFLVIGNSLSCRNEREEFMVESHSFYLSYEVDYRYFKENLPNITPIEFHCDFKVINKMNKPLLMSFVYNNNDTVHFNPNKAGDYFYTISEGDSVIALRPLHRSVTVIPYSSEIVTVKFPYRESNKLKEAVKGVSMEQITEKISHINFFFKRNFNKSSAIETSKRDLNVYFLLSDTSITCNTKGCFPYVDPATLR